MVLFIVTSTQMEKIRFANSQKINTMIDQHITGSALLSSK